MDQVSGSALPDHGPCDPVPDSGFVVFGAGLPRDGFYVAVNNHGEDGFIPKPLRNITLSYVKDFFAEMQQNSAFQALKIIKKVYLCCYI
jgi:hypothetical protein